MRGKTCPREKAVLEGLQKDRFTPALERHRAGCPICREVSLVFDWMNRFGKVSRESEMAEKVLPSPESLWTRTLSIPSKRRALAKKALRPLQAARLLAFAGTTVVLFLFVFSNLRGFSGFLQVNPPARAFIDRLAAIVPSPVQWLLLFAIPLAIILLSMGFCGLVTLLEGRGKNEVLRPTD